MHVFASIGLRSDPCDAKAHIADYMTEIGIPKTLLVVPFFYEDFLHSILKPTQTNQKDTFKIGEYFVLLKILIILLIFKIAGTEW